MKQRAFLWAFSSFLAGMGVAFGLVHLDRQTMVPRLDRTDIFEVVSSDGTVLRLSYAEIERERQELSEVRQRLMESVRTSAQRRANGEYPPSPVREPSLEEAPPETVGEASGGGTEAQGAQGKERNLQKLFAKIFSQPVMEDLVQAQITRESGELADVLDLTDEQLTRLEGELKKRRSRFPTGFRAASAGSEEEEPGPQTSLEEELQSILTPEQYQRYREYTEKKAALQAAPPLDRDLLELSWRLDLSEEQEGPIRQILKEQEDRMRQLSPAASPEGDASPAERLEKHLESRTALNQETAERVKTVLDEGQYDAFLRYQEEKDTETRLLRRLIQEEKSNRVPAATQ